MLKQFKDKNQKIRLVLLFFLLIVVGLLFYQKLFIFSVIMVFSALLQYTTHRQDIKINLGHVFFLGLITVSQIGLVYGILLIVFAEFLPKAMVGDMEARTIFSLPLSIVMMVLFSSLKDYSFTLVGILLVIINYTLLYFFSKISRDPMPEKLLEIGLPFLLNIIYILSASEPIISIVGRVISA